MAAISSLFLVFTLFIVSLLTILALIVRPRPVKIPGGGSSGIDFENTMTIHDICKVESHLSASEGAGVSIFARSLSKLADAKRSIRLATGVEVATFSADVRDYDAVSKSVHQSGPIDVLIVNQGVFIGKELEKQSTEEVKFMIDVNLVGSWSGIYGYTAYSASKFGLQGLAQALQQEVISHDIHVSLLFPPDTDTPGFEEEQKKRPELTSIIASSSGSMKTREVAKICLDGIKSGKFTATCHFIGYLLSIATSGVSPQRSFWHAFMEVMFGGFVGLFFQWGWYNTIAKWSNTKKKANSKLA
ncbi:unnamed protein product [Brassica napus]|uniref:(rape) hypothetical protein n=1 Tax=Brassica napus TaxID=3708 RepID=A0A816J5G1_BRANA|nr:unnamed protein product [Brassica napus]